MELVARGVGKGCECSNHKQKQKRGRKVTRQQRKESLR